MCGLTMVVNKNRNGFNKQQQDLFSSLLYLSGGFRGRDGAGVAVIDNIGNVKMAKDSTSVDPFLLSKEYDELNSYAFQKGWAMIGHNRAATRGTIVDKNSHPFIVDDKIVLVHNGTFLGDHKKLKDTEVDSEAIAHVLLENEDIEKALRKIQAAYALIWYDVEGKKINVIRNSQRPLWFMETHNSYVFSSEQIFLNFVIDKFGIKPTEGPYELKEQYLCKFLLKENKDTELEGKELDVSYWKHNTVEISTSDYPFSQHYGMNPQKDSFQRFVESKYSDTGLIFSVPVVDRVVTCIGARAVPTLYSNFQGDLIKKYPTNSKVRVLVNDLVEADSDPKSNNFILIGKTMDEHNLHVAFPLLNHTLEDAINLTSAAVFDVETAGVTWRRVDHLFPINSCNPMETWEGISILHGKNGVPVYMLEGNKDNAH